MDANDPQLKQIWTQTEIPVVFRGGPVRPLLVRLPFRDSNYSWLRHERRAAPEWLGRYKAWSIPKSWFENTLQRCLAQFGTVYVIQPFKTTEKCAPACWNAKGAECECSCLGKNHGSGNPIGKWHIVSDTFAVSWNERRYSCRLLLPA